MKRIFLMLTLVAFPTVLQAQEVPQTYQLMVTVPEINVIAKGLGTLPYNDVAPLMQKLQQQITSQQKPVDKPKEEKHD
jgi:hypothetical protein